ncbi:MAG: hypothetical protein II794_01465 [Oscillospiraceae bacterium]|nr:hypothetical protein [Oscillospiraceae bacterium]
MRPNGPETARLAELFIRTCEEGEVPADYILERVTGLTEAQWTRLRTEGNQLQRQAAERVRAYREYYWIRRGVQDPKAAVFSTFNLRRLGEEPDGGGEEVTVAVRMDGVGEGAFD